MKPKSVLSIAFHTSALRMNGIPNGHDQQQPVDP